MTAATDSLSLRAEALRTVIVSDLQALPVDRDTWNALAQASETNTLFQTYEWMQCWCDAFAQNRMLWILLVYSGNALVGIAPLLLEDASGRRRTLKFLGDTHADYCDVLAGENKRAVLNAFLAALAARRSDWDRLSLLNLPDGTSTLALLRELAPAHDLHLVHRGKVVCPTLELDRLPAGGASLLERQSLKRPYNYFRRQGSLTVRHIADRAAAEELLPGFFEQHIARWSSTRTRSLFERTANRAFYATLVHALLPTGWLRFTVVELDGRPIAYHLGFVYAGRFIWYKPAFDFQLRKHSPGALLLRFLLQHAIQEHCTEFDFTIGNEPFKRRYANTIRYNRNVILLTGRLPQLWERMTAGCKRLLRRIHRGTE